MWRFIHAQMAQSLVVLRIRTVQEVERGGVASMIPAGLSGTAAALRITHKLAFSGTVADMHQSALLRTELWRTCHRRLSCSRFVTARYSTAQIPPSP